MPRKYTAGDKIGALTLIRQLPGTKASRLFLARCTCGASVEITLSQAATHKKCNGCRLGPCLHCGQPITKTGGRTYCSRECAAEAYADRKKAKRHEMTPEERALEAEQSRKKRARDAQRRASSPDFAADQRRLWRRQYLEKKRGVSSRARAKRAALSPSELETVREKERAEAQRRREKIKADPAQYERAQQNWRTRDRNRALRGAVTEVSKIKGKSDAEK